MSLWEEARDKFIDDLRGQGVDRQTVDFFLQDKATSDDVKRSCLSLQADSDRKYGQAEVVGKSISGKWLAQIMDNIDHFVSIGNFMMKGSPETVGLAWFAVKQVLNAVQNNYKLYGFFGQALTNITEMLVLIRTYDKLYDERKNSRWTASDIVGELFSQIRNVYAAILDFSFSVKKHIKAGKMAKVGHAIKDMFGADLPEFEGKMATIQALKVKILEASQGAFQEKTFEQFKDVKGTLSNVSGTLSYLSEAVQSSLQNTEEMKQLLEESLKSTKFKSIYEIAMQEFEKNKKALNPLPESRSTLATHVKQCREETCNWITELDQYKKWRESQGSSILCIKGESGSGKSVLLASIIQRLQSELSACPEYAIQYHFCEASKAGDDSASSLTRIQKTLIYQLYELSTYSEADSVVLQRCNDVFKNPKQKKTQSALTGSGMGGKSTGHSKSEDAGPDIDDAFDNLASALGKKIFLIIDAVDCIQESGQDEFVSGLQAMIGREGLRIQVLLSCRPLGIIYKRLIHDVVPQISMEGNNSTDIDLIITKEINVMPQWSPTERDEARQKILEKTGSSFKYAVQVALPFLRQPFQRPISNRLKELPDNMNETYSVFLRQLAPNYLNLLKTALTWALLTDADIDIHEVMDAYTGTYLIEGAIDDLQECTSFEDSKLQADQIRDAGGPFLDVIDDGTKHIVALKDRLAVQSFCYECAESQKSRQDQGDEICANCKAQLNPSHTLSLSEKSGHLSLAITCLHHLNSPLFQKRYLFKGLEESDILANSQHQEGTDIDTSKEDPVEGVNAMKDQEMDAEGQSTRELHPENGASNDNPENDSSDKEAVKSLDEEADDDESQDSEDRDVPGWAQNQTGDIDKEEYDDWGQDENVRYEIKYWFFHVREAERLWTPEERRNSKQWAVLLAEFDKFFNKDVKAFNAWKMLQFRYGGRKFEPVHVAAYYGLTSLTEQLLLQGIDIQTVTPEGWTPLQLAAGSDHPLDELKLLLAHKANPNFQMQGLSIPALHYWVYCQPELEYEYFQEFLRSGASCSLTTLDGYNILHYFAFFGSDPKVLNLLLDNEEDPSNRIGINDQDENGETPLHKLMARTSIPLDLLEAFITRGADVNAEDKASERPLWEAASYGENSAIKSIIGKVSDIDDVNNMGRTALHAAAWQGRTETVELLLSHGANPNKTDGHGRTPFFFACLCSMASLASSEVTAQILLERLLKDNYKIEEINKPTKRGRTPLREAAAHGFLKIVQTMLNMIKPDDQDTIGKADTIKGRNALHCAAFRGRAEVVKLLLHHGADATVRDGKEATGKTALELCHEQWATVGSTQYESVLSVLIDYDTTAAAQNKELLTTAAINGSTLILEKLLDAKADLNEPDQYGWTPLLLARQFQRTEAVTFLSRRVAQIGMKPTKWIYSYKSDWTQVTADGLGLKHPRGRRLCVLADHPIPAGLNKYYYEIEISKSSKGDEDDPSPHPILAIGFCTSSAQALEFPGWPNGNAPNSHSWAYHGDDGGFFTSFKKRPLGNSKLYGPGDTVGCGVNYEDSTIFCTLNGQKIDEPHFDDVRGRLFPVLGLMDDVAIEANFGNDLVNKPFKWSEDSGVVSKEEPLTIGT